MPIKAEPMAREFSFNGVRLPDPNPVMSVEQVRDLYAATYADIATAAVEGPEALGNKMRYRFTRAVGTKG